MAEFEHDLLIAPITLAGKIMGVVVEEEDGAGAFVAGGNIIRTDRQWRVKVNWKLVGSVLAAPWALFPGDWVLKAYIEGWGLAATELDQTGDTATIDLQTGQAAIIAGPPAEWEYAETFTFPVGRITTPGTYKLAVAITAQTKAGKPIPMAGFIEYGEMLQLYNP